MKTITKLFLLACIALIAAPGAYAQVDCAALYANGSALPEPAECAGFAPSAALTPVPGRAPTDLANGLSVGGFGTPGDYFEHALNDFPGQTSLGNNLDAIFAMEYDQTGTLYGLRFDDNMMVTMNPATGASTAVGPLTGLVAGHTVSGLGFTADNTCYAYSTDGLSGVLYTCDTATGALTVVGSQNTAVLMIAIAVTCEGEIFGHDIGDDNIYSIDPGTGGVTVIGLTGVNSNFAQGMTYDRDEGTVYAYTYQGGGANAYGTIDTGSGALTPLAVTNPAGEFVGAAQTFCAVAGPPDTLGIPTLGGIGMAALVALLLLASLYFLRRQPAA